MTLPLPLAARLLRSSHVRGAALAIALSMVPLIVIFIVADGMIEGITSRYIELKSYHARAYLPEGADAEAAVRSIRAIPGVTGAYLEIQGEGLVRSAAGSTAVRLRCVDPAIGEDAGFSRYLAVESGVFELDTAGAALLGVETARRLEVHVGDRLQLATLRSLGASALPRLSALTVVGTFGTGYQELDKSWVFVSVRDGEGLLASGRRERFVGVKLQEPFGDRHEVLRAIRAAVPSARVYDWYQLESNQFRSFDVTRNLLIFVMGLIVVVGCVNVSSSVLMLVLERRQDIGILKSMGASPASIRRVFTLVGALVGVAGCMGGLLLGLLVGVHVNELFSLVEAVVNAVAAGAAWVRSLGGAQLATEPFRILGSAYYLERIPVHLRLPQLYAAAAGTIALASLAAWIPARRAGDLRPLEVIRKH